MKIIPVLLAVMLVMTGCELWDKTSDDSFETDVSSDPTENAEETAEPAVDYVAYYQPILAELFGVVSGNYDENNIPEGGSGLLGGGDMLGNAGYRIADYSGDRIPELLIGDVNNGMIYALYTVKDGQVHLTLEGAYRNAYYLLEDGSVFRQASGGAIYSIFGLYDLSADGSETICRDYWFTHEKDGDYEDIRCWHNTVGDMDIAVSEELAMTLEEFWAMEEKYADKIIVPKLIPFAEWTDG